MQDKYIQFKARMTDAGIDFIITCTKRTQEEQEELYAQGRTKPGKIVTWTLKSKHIEGRAFDIAILKNGKITWDTADYQQAGEIGESAGLQWGGRWKSPDYPHFQLQEEG